MTDIIAPLRRHAGLLLVCVTVAPVLAVVAQSTSASYAGRSEITLDGPATAFKSAPVLDELFARTRALDERIDRDELAARLTVLQPSGEGSAQLVARARSLPAALALADVWAATVADTLPGTRVASPAVSVGYAEKVPWPAPLAGLGVGLAFVYLRTGRARRAEG